MPNISVGDAADFEAWAEGLSTVRNFYSEVVADLRDHLFSDTGGANLADGLAELSDLWIDLNDAKDAALVPGLGGDKRITVDAGATACREDRTFLEQAIQDTLSIELETLRALLAEDNSSKWPEIEAEGANELNAVVYRLEQRPLSPKMTGDGQGLLVTIREIYSYRLASATGADLPPRDHQEAVTSSLTSYFIPSLESVSCYSTSTRGTTATTLAAATDSPVTTATMPSPTATTTNSSPGEVAYGIEASLVCGSQTQLIVTVTNSGSVSLKQPQVLINIPNQEHGLRTDFWDITVLSGETATYIATPDPGIWDVPNPSAEWEVDLIVLVNGYGYFERTVVACSP